MPQSANVSVRSTLVSSARRAAALLLAAAVAGGGVLGVVATATPVAAELLDASLPPGSFSRLAKQLSPAVVNISTAQTVTRPNRPMPDLPENSPFRDFFDDFFNGEGGSQRVQSLGSGFVISADGYVVTNNHVIEGADEIEVNFADGRVLPASLIGSDKKTDLALLKVIGAENLPFVPFGDSNAAEVGDWVLAIGNPFGLGGSVSAGIISARDRDINSGPYDNYIQTDAAINRGNSGGPLFNMSGEVIGVNTAIISPSGGSIGIGFSVPSEMVEQVIEQLREFGRTRRGWLGVKIQNIDDSLAANLGLDSTKGAMVTGVSDGGPAEAAGVERGDVILSFNGQDIFQMRDLPRIVADTEVDSTAELEVFRDGEVIVLDVVISLLEEASDAQSQPAPPDSDPDSGAQTALGLTLKELTPANRKSYAIGDDVEGVLISAVDQASSAAEQGIRAGDVLVEVASEPVMTPDAAQAAIDRAAASGRSSVLLMLHRDGGLTFIAVEFNR